MKIYIECSSNDYHDDLSWFLYKDEPFFPEIDIRIGKHFNREKSAVTFVMSRFVTADTWGEHETHSRKSDII